MSQINKKYEIQNIRQSVSERDSFTVERYEQFFAFFPRQTKIVLDIGCNTGRGGLRLKELNSDLTLLGLDCVRERLEILPECYSQKIYGLSTEIPLEDKAVDTIVGGEFLEHLYPADVDKTLCEFQRVLKIGGRLLLTTPNPRYIKSKLDKTSVYGTSHLTQHFPEALKFRLKMHGFSNISVRGSGKVSRYIGRYFPIMAVYGSYLILGDKW